MERTINGIRKIKMITSEAKRYDLKVLGIAEHRWVGEGHYRLQDGGMIIYSGGKSTGMCEVGFYLSSDLEKALMGDSPVNERIVLVRSRQRNLTIIKVYAPTTQADDEEIEAFYEKLQVTVKEVNKRDVIVIMGDFNTQKLVKIWAGYIQMQSGHMVWEKGIQEETDWRILL